jgi:hypothetical protein
MRFADSKDIKRAQDLGKHSTSVYLSTKEIAKGKARTMASAITDRRKILGRLEAVASVWDDYPVISPFIQKCVSLWPDSQYSKAYYEAINQRGYLKSLIAMGFSKEYLLDKYLIRNGSGVFISGHPYEFDEVGVIIFNTMLKNLYYLI